MDHVADKGKNNVQSLMWKTQAKVLLRRPRSRRRGYIKMDFKIMRIHVAENKTSSKLL